MAIKRQSCLDSYHALSLFVQTIITSNSALFHARFHHHVMLCDVTVVNASAITRVICKMDDFSASVDVHYSMAARWTRSIFIHFITSGRNYRDLEDNGNSRIIMALMVEFKVKERRCYVRGILKKLVLLNKSRLYQVVLFI